MQKNLNKILEWAMVILLCTMLFSVLLGVFTRYVFANQSSWTDELARYMLIWVSILGAAYVSGKNAHIAIDLLPARLSEKLKLRLEMATGVIICLFIFAVFIVGGIRYIYLSMKLGQTSASLEIPVGYVYLVLPLSGAIIIYFRILGILQSAKALKSLN